MNDAAISTVQDPNVDTDLTKGLTAAEASARLEQYGPNALAEKRTSTLHRLTRYFWGPIPWMIEAAAILSPCWATGRTSPSS